MMNGSVSIKDGMVSIRVKDGGNTYFAKAKTVGDAWEIIHKLKAATEKGSVEEIFAAMNEVEQEYNGVEQEVA